MKKNNILKLCLGLLLTISVLPYVVFAQEEDEKDNIEIVKDVKYVTKAGTYFIVVDVDSEGNLSEPQKVKVHVKYPKTNLNYKKNEGIDAHDIVTLTGTFDKSNKEEIIESGGAHAWSMETGDPIREISVDVKEPIQFSGTVNTVTYSTKNNTTVDVNVFEQDEIHIKLDELYMNQYPVLHDRVRTLSNLIVFLAVIPSLTFLILFKIVSKKTKDVEKLLTK